MKRTEKYRSKKKQYYSENKEKYIARLHARRTSDLNSNGQPKFRIRRESAQLLYRTHSKLPGYEIHHCFGYDDFRKFIYIPRSLHLQIHQLLRDRNIPSDSEHWNVIRDLVNSCDQYTYIRA